jgi:hypothetical protein
MIGITKFILSVALVGAVAAKDLRQTNLRAQVAEDLCAEAGKHTSCDLKAPTDMHSMECIRYCTGFKDETNDRQLTCTYDAQVKKCKFVRAIKEECKGTKDNKYDGGSGTSCTKAGCKFNMGARKCW